MIAARAYVAGRCSGHVSRRQRAQRGQALLEFTMFFTFLMILLAGVTDLASLLDDHVDLVYAARQGARTGAVLGPALNADCQIIGAIQATLLNQPDVTLTTITIYQAGAGGAPTGLQDVYQGADHCNSSGTFVLGGPIGGGTWVPTGTPPPRINTSFTEDSLGVRLDYTYQWRFGFFGGGTFSGYDTAVYPLSPAGLPTPTPTGIPPATPTPCPPIIVCV